MSSIAYAIGTVCQEDRPTPDFQFPVILDDGLQDMARQSGNPSLDQIVRLAATAVDLVAGMGDDSEYVDFGILVQTSKGQVSLMLRACWSTHYQVQIAPC